MTKRRLSEQHALGARGSGPRTSRLDTGSPGAHSALDSRASFPCYSACGVGGCTGHPPPRAPWGTQFPSIWGTSLPCPKPHHPRVHRASLCCRAPPAFATWARRLPGQVGWTAREGGSADHGEGWGVGTCPSPRVGQACSGNTPPRPPGGSTEATTGLMGSGGH